MAAAPTPGPSLRMAELLAPLSLVTDLGMGEPDEQALRATLIAVRLAERSGLGAQETADAYYTTLLRHIGCTATAHEESLRMLPDEIALRARVSTTDFPRPAEAIALTRAMLQQVPLARRPGLAARMATSGRWGRRVERAICEVAAAMASRLDMSPEVERGVFEVRERWDGKGEPRRIGGEDIAPAARIAAVASQAASLDSALGPEAAVELVRRRGGAWLDPSLAETFAEIGASVLAEIGELDLLSAVLDAEPDPPLRVPAGRIDDVARAFADMTDLKSPSFHGHSAGVARLAEEAGASLGLDGGELLALRRAALLHDLGRVAVPNGIWEKPGALTQSDWERVRLHPYHSERILARCSALAELAPLAGMHHERQDASGYHRQVGGPAVPPAARILAAADALHAMTEARPHRPALALERAGEELQAGGEHGGFDPEAVRAVCEAAGTSRPRRTAWPAGLSDREVEVLRLLAQGLSNKEIARSLFISPRTAEHHVQHVYGKIGVSTRAGAAMFAMRNDLAR